MTPSDKFPEIRRNEARYLNTRKEMLAVLAAVTAPVLLIVLFVCYYHYLN